MQAVLGVVAPLWIVIGLGWVSVRTGYVPRSALPVISGFVLKVTLPALMFTALATRPIGEIVHPTYLLVYAVGSVAAWVFGVAAMRVVTAGDAGHRALVAYAGLGASTSNSAFVGLPVLQGIAPQIAAPAFGMNLLVENLLTVPMSMALAEHRVSGGASHREIAAGVVRRLVRTPMILAIVAGGLASLLAVPLPDAIRHSLTLVGQATTAPALFLIGATLAGRRPHGRIVLTMPVLVGKLAVHPAAVALVAHAVTGLAPALGLPPLDPTLRTAAIVSAAAPAFSILPVIAAQHGEEDIMTAAAFVTTVSSLATLTAVLVLVAPA